MEQTVAPNNYGNRADGTPKGNGHLGPLTMTDGSGRVITELSVGVNIDGEEVEIPTVVPTLSPEEKAHLQAGGDPTDAIVKKAVDFAKERKSKGLGPFKEESEENWQDSYSPDDNEDPSIYEYVDSKPAPVDNKVAKRTVNGFHAALKAADKGGDYPKAYLDAQISDQNPVDNYSENVNEGVKSVIYGLSTYGGATPEQVATAVETRLTHMNGVEGMKKYLAYVNSMEISKKMSPEEKELAASQAYRQDLAAQVWDEVSTGKAITDFAQMVLLPTDNWKMAKLAEYVGIEPTVRDYVTKGSFVNRFMDSYQQLPPATKAIIANDIVRNWETIGGFDNKVELMAFLARMEGMDSFDKAMTYFEGLTDVVSLIGAPLKAVKVVSNTARLGSAAMSAKRVGKIVASMNQKAAVAEAAIQKAGVLHRAAAIENTDLVADLAITGAQGKLTNAGVDTVTAANTMTPFETIRALTPGAPEGQAASILKRQQVLDEIVDNAKAMNLPMDEAERAAFIERKMAKIADEHEVATVRLIDSTPEGFKLSVTHTGGEETLEHTFKYTDLGTWEDMRYRHAGILGSPKFKLPGIARDLVDAVQFGLNKGAKLKGQFDKVIKSSRKVLSRGQSERVDALLSFGEGKKVFSYDEAVRQGVHGLKLTDDEYQAYAATRQVFDSLKQLKEAEILADWKMNNIKMFDLNSSRQYGKVYEDIDSAGGAFRAHKKDISSFLQDGKVVNGVLTEATLKQAYMNGYKLVKATGSSLFHVSDKYAAEWALVKAGDLSNHVGPVLNHIPGYVTRISKDGNFFLKKSREVIVGTEKRTIWETVGYDEIYSDLEKYRLTLPDADKYKVFADREMSRVDYEGDVIQSFGGLYKGARSSEPLVYGLGKKQAKFAPVLESLQRYIQNVAKNQPIAIYREGLKQKWINTAVKNGMISEHDAATKSFAELGTILNQKHEKYHFFDRSHKEIRFVSGIKTLEETEWDARLYSFGRWAEKKGWSKPMASFFYDGTLQKIDSALMSGTYHTLLGFGNMAQIPLQFSAALIPVAINPLAGAKGLYSALGMTVLDYMNELGKISHAKTNKVDMNLWKLWNESGMRDATKYATFDYFGMFNDTPYKATWFDKLMSKSDVAVRIGQMGANRVAFATAYHQVAAKLGRVPGMDDLLEISAKADEYLLNMGRANMAEFQKRGDTRYAGMFMQVQTKFIEKIFGSEFTGIEKARLMIAQAAMFGAQGVPFVGSIGNRLLAACGFDGESVDSDILAVLQRGAFGWYMTDYLGTNADFSGRLSLGNDIAEKMIGMVYGETNMMEMVGGAPWSVAERAYDTLDRAFFAANVVARYDNLSPKLVLSASEVIAKELLSFPVATANLIKGVAMKTSGMYSDKNGIPVFMYRDPSLMPAIAQSLGFHNLESSNWYQMEGQSLMGKPEAKASLAKCMAGLMVKLINADAERQEVYALAYNALASMGLSLPGGENLNDQVIKYLRKPDKGWEDQYLKGIQKMNNEYHESMDEWFKVMNIRSSVDLDRELEKHGVN